MPDLLKKGTLKRFMAPGQKVHKDGIQKQLQLKANYFRSFSLINKHEHSPYHNHLGFR